MIDILNEEEFEKARNITFKGKEENEVLVDITHDVILFLQRKGLLPLELLSVLTAAHYSFDRYLEHKLKELDKKDNLH